MLSYIYLYLSYRCGHCESSLFFIFQILSKILVELYPPCAYQFRKIAVRHPAINWNNVDLSWVNRIPVKKISEICIKLQKIITSKYIQKCSLPPNLFQTRRWFQYGSPRNRHFKHLQTKPASKGTGSWGPAETTAELYEKGTDTAITQGCPWMQVSGRVMHHPSKVAVLVGLSVGYKASSPIGWNHPFVIGWSKYRWKNVSASRHRDLMWLVGMTIVFQGPLTVPMHSPNGRQMPAVRAVQGDRERAYDQCRQMRLPGQDPCRSWIILYSPARTVLIYALVTWPPFDISRHNFDIPVCNSVISVINRLNQNVLNNILREILKQ